jgi:tetratricopeptide (TPR) repeat protein
VRQGRAAGGLVRLRRWEEGAAGLEAAIASGYRSAYLYSRLAVARGSAGDADGARRALERGLEEHPGDGQLLLALGRLEKRSGHPAAARHIEEAASRLPGDPYAYKELVATRAAERGGRAVEELRRLLRVPSQARNPHLHDELARLLAAEGDDAGALAAARQAFALEPASRLFRRRLAFALVRAREDREAVELLERCLEDEPEDPALNRSYVAARRRLGQLDEAHGFYRRLLQSHPEARKVFGWLRKVGREAEAAED